MATKIQNSKVESEERDCIFFSRAVSSQLRKPCDIVSPNESSKIPLC